jgi:hypothetical protein
MPFKALTCMVEEEEEEKKHLPPSLKERQGKPETIPPVRQSLVRKLFLLLSIKVRVTKKQNEFGDIDSGP